MRLLHLIDQVADLVGMAENEDVTKEELYEEAQERDLPGRSQMTKDELAEALGKDDPNKIVEGELTPLAEWRKNTYEGGRPAK